MIRVADAARAPTGTVTFLFTDVEGSTRLLHELGAEAYAEALAEHRRIIREACAAEGGVEVDTQGDAFFFAFPTAPGAARRSAGLHRGADSRADPGSRGPPHRLAASHRRGVRGRGRASRRPHRRRGPRGQVLVAASTATLVDVELLDLGEHRFKDLGAPERVHQLGSGDFPPLRSLYRTNLPVPANPLVGRKQELVDALRLVAGDETRLVTVTGPGGVGKTRFALALAAEAADGYPDGVWFVDLSPLRDPALVLPTLAHVLGADADLARHLGDSRCLLLLDNFEQVVGAAGDMAELLGAARGVRVLATSREPLRIAAEREYPLDPLPESPAVELFRHRAAAMLPDADVVYDTAAEICRRLDGLPLAIELAAARTRVFEPQALLERLEQRLPILVGRARDVPERQQTLRATIAWSYELLEPREQELFRRLAVFRGGSTLESIEAVTGAGSELAESLVDKSLLRLRRARLVMLETIREYARDLLEESGEDGNVRLRHAEHVAEVAERANLNAGNLRPGGQRLDIAIAEQDNIRAALSWTIATDNAALGLRIATAIEQFWVVNDPEEGGAGSRRSSISRTRTPSTQAFARRRCAHGEARSISPETASALSASTSRAWRSTTPWATTTAAQSSSIGSASGRCGRATSAGRVRSSERAMRSTSGTATPGVWRRSWGRSARSSATPASSTAPRSSSRTAQGSRSRPAFRGGTPAWLRSWPRSPSRRTASTTRTRGRARRSGSCRRCATTAAASSASGSSPASLPGAGVWSARAGCGARSRRSGSAHRSAGGFAIARGSSRGSRSWPATSSTPPSPSAVSCPSTTPSRRPLPRTDLPSGTVTFLFTDVEGSTRLLHELGAEGYSEALAEHRGVIREACAAEGGVEVDTQGDAFFFAFPTAPGALGAAPRRSPRRSPPARSRSASACTRARRS